MKNYITDLQIEKVRHLKDIHISLSADNKKHLILTGKNGSGKTSLLDAIQSYLQMYSKKITLEKLEKDIETYEKALQRKNINALQTIEYEQGLSAAKNRFSNYTQGIILTINSEVDIISKYETGDFIMAYYKVNRVYDAIIPKHIEKITFKDQYAITDTPGKELIKYLLDLKTTQALAEKANKKRISDEIEEWFQNFEKLLQMIFDDSSLILDFNIETFEFSIIIKDREPFGFNQMSSGYSAILEIVVGLMLRMEHKTRGFYEMHGIVLIDEIETHLHLELQKKIFPFLTNFFPNIQFIVTTHSPFVLNTAENAVIYDLESNVKITEGMRNLPYSGIVEGYFEVDELSYELERKFKRYKELFEKETLEPEDYAELPGLEIYLNEVPDYLAVGFSSEYNRMKLEFKQRG